MNLPVVAEVRDELAASKALMDKNLSQWSGKLSGFFRDIEDDMHWHMLPQVTALAYQGLKAGFRCTVYMTTIFRLAYLANYIHDTVRDDEEGQAHDRRLQFDILIGDYLFGKVLQLLSENSSQSLASTFAEMIIDINEGRVIRKMRGGCRNDLEIITKEVACLYSYAFLTAAKKAGLHTAEQMIYREVGNKIGLALGVRSERIPGISPLRYLEEARYLLTFANDSAQDRRLLIPRLLQEMLDQVRRETSVSVFGTTDSVLIQTL